MFNLYTLEKSISKHLEAAQVPGLALAIVQDEEILYARGFGITSVEDGGIPVTPQTLFRIGSTTAALTGTAIMRLVEAGALELDRPLQSYLPWLTFSNSDSARQITLRMLLSHTAGLPTDASTSGRRDPEGLEAFIREELPRYPLVAAPGKLFSYSNLGIMLAGCVAQSVYGQPYAQMMQDLVFGPLAMSRTTFDPTVAMTYPLAQPHIQNAHGTLVVEHRFAENSSGHPSDFAFSSALDMANFALVHLNQGCFQRGRYLSPDSINAMQHAHTRLFIAKDVEYGLTFSLESYKDLRLVGHDGAINSFGCQLTMLPEARIATVLLYNRLELDGIGILHRIFDRLLPTLKNNPVKARRSSISRVASGRTRWPRYVGTYLSPYIGLSSVAIIKNQLTLEFHDERIVLQAQRKDFYIGICADGETRVSIGFVLEEDGPAQYAIINPYADNSVFHLLECKRIDPATFESTTWPTYVGTYNSPEFGTFTASLEENVLVLSSENIQEKARCTPVSGSQFACRWGLFEFQLAPDGVAMQMIHKGHMQVLQRT